MSWHVVVTKPGREQQAFNGLLEQRFDAYLPVYCKMVRHANRTVIKHKPLFPNYIFVALEPDQRWYPIGFTAGVWRVLAYEDGRPIPLPEGLIEDMKKRQAIAGGVFQLPNVKARAYTPGQKVRVIDGNWTGYEGLYLAADHDRVTLLLDILGGQRKVEFPHKVLQPA